MMCTKLSFCAALAATILTMDSEGAVKLPARAEPSYPHRHASLATHRVDRIIDRDWHFSKSNLPENPQSPLVDDAAWEVITLPHTWNNTDGEDGGGDYYRGTGWYRKHLTPDLSLRGRRLFLQFDGANTTTEAYVNGQLVGVHKGGFAAFRFEVTAELQAGRDNLIAVRVSNAPDPDVPPLDADFTFFGGLYRHVHLLCTDPLALTALDCGSSGVYLRALNVSARSAEFEVTSRVSNGSASDKDASVISTLVDASGRVVETLHSRHTMRAHSTEDVIQHTTVSHPHLWDGRHDPYLYRVYVEVDDGAHVTDGVLESFGFRSFSIDRDKGFILNGRALDLHGVNKHQDRLDKGWAISESDMDEDFALIEELGANALRLAHYQHPQHEYALADRKGLVVWAEIPLVNRITASGAFAQNARQQLTELIRQNMNHPSIVFWSIANEVTLQHGPDPNALLDSLAELARREDPTRLSTIASCASDEDSTNDHTAALGFNKYFGWYGGALRDFAAWADRYHANKALAQRKIAITEYGAGASIHFHSDNPHVNDHTEEYQCLFHEAYWRAMTARPFLWGKFVWNMFDFAADQRSEGDQKGRNDKGLITYDRKTKKDPFFYYKANWSSTPFVHITSRRFNPRVKSPVEVKIYATVKSVELKLNGTSLGAKTSADHVFLWPQVKLMKGANVLEASGGPSVHDRVVWNH